MGGEGLGRSQLLLGRRERLDRIERLYASRGRLRLFRSADPMVKESSVRLEEDRNLIVQPKLLFPHPLGSRSEKKRQADEVGTPLGHENSAPGSEVHVVRVGLSHVTPHVVAIDNDGTAGLESKRDALLCPGPGLGAVTLVPPVLRRETELDHYTSVDMMAQGADCRNGLEANLVDPGVAFLGG